MRLMRVALPGQICIQVSMKNDVKGVYKENMGKTDIVGLGQRFDEPVNCDLRIKVDEMTEEESF